MRASLLFLVPVAAALHAQPPRVSCADPAPVAVPPSTGDAVLYAVKAFGDTAFAVGTYWDRSDPCDRAGDRGSCLKPLVARLVGDRWRTLLPPPPLPGGDARLVNSWLISVDGTSDDDVWTVGTVASDTGDALCTADEDCPNSGVLAPDVPFNVPRRQHACGASGRCLRYADLIYHWNGATWTRHRAGLESDWGGPLLVVDAFTAGAVDFYGNGPPLPGYTRGDAEHWDGAGFSAMATTDDAPGLAFASLRLDAGDQWVGGEGIWHHAGDGWSSADFPVNGLDACAAGACGFFQINGFDRDPRHAGQLWAVGEYVNFTVGAFLADDCEPGADCGCAADADCPNGACRGGVCGQLTGLNLLYAAHYDGAAWSRVPAADLPDSDQCLWSIAAQGSDVWAVGGRGPDTVENNFGRNCLAYDATTVLEHGGAGGFRQAAPSVRGFLYGVDVLAGGDAVAVGSRLEGDTLHAIAQRCTTR